MRSGRNIARGFNMDEDEVRTRFVRPLQGSDVFFYQDKKWDPREVRLMIVEGAKLGPGQLSLGQGWTNAAKRGVDVTERFLTTSAPAAAAISQANAEAVGKLKERLLGRLAAGPLALGEAIAITGDLMPSQRVSERLGAVETAIWELLHAGNLALIEEPDGEPLAQDGWQTVLLDPVSWLSGRSDGPQVSAATS